jgi:hypothetical protein
VTAVDPGAGTRSGGALGEFGTVILACDDWLRRHDYAGYDPYDALNGSRVPGFVRRQARLRQATIQVVKRAPVNLRSLLGVPPQRIGKGLALVASAYAGLHQLTGDDAWRDEARGLLEDLERRALVRQSGLAWGYEFDVQTRWAFYPAGTPNIIATTFVANAFLDWYECCGEQEYLDVAGQAAGFLLERLLVDDATRTYFAYVPRVRTLVHNANLLGCGFLARLSRLNGNDGLCRIALKACEVGLAGQNASGFWPYGEGRGLEWVDGLHTAYVLGGLYDVWCASGDGRVHDALQAGLRAYREGLFTLDDVPMNTTAKLYPVDIHSASSAIELFVRAAEVDERCLGQARRVASWAISNLYDQRGFFYCQKTRWYTNRIPYVRWSQAHMLKALTAVANAMRP